MQSTYWLEKVLKMISFYVNVVLCTLQHIVIDAMQLSGVNSPNWHRWVASRVWQYASAYTKVHWRTRRSFSAPSLTSKYFAFAFVYFLYRVRDLRPRWSTKRLAGFSCAILYNKSILCAWEQKYSDKTNYVDASVWKDPKAPLCHIAHTFSASLISTTSDISAT